MSNKPLQPPAAGQTPQQRGTPAALAGPACGTQSPAVRQGLQVACLREWAQRQGVQQTEHRDWLQRVAQRVE